MLTKPSKLGNFLLALIIAATSFTSASAYSLDDGRFYYRYKYDLTATTPKPTPEVKKDVTAYYVAGLGQSVNELLPLKPEWEDDSWSIVAGTLPEGLRFDQSTRSFVGIPTELATNVSVDLIGRNVDGTQVATATAIFDVYELPDTVVNVDFYAHTGKFSSNALQLPAGLSVYGDPQLLTPTPPGITYNARYFEGTPTESQLAPYPVLAIGYDFAGNAVVAFKGSYLVEDRPKFPTPPDDLRPISNRYGYAGWYKDPIPKIVRSIGDASKVRYYVETESGATLPGSLNYSNDPFNRQLSGFIYDYYSQVNVRYRAVDVDGVEGFSDWFRLGSLGNEAVCTPLNRPSINLVGTADTKFNDYKIPSGADSSKRLYSVINGALPAGLTLDPETGVISGTPTRQEEQLDVRVRVDFPESLQTGTITCGPYKFTISPAAFFLNASSYPKQVRVGSPFDVTVTPSGGLLSPYSLALESENSVLPTDFVFEPATGKLSGTVSEAGAYSATFRLVNGDGVEKRLSISFSGHDRLHIDNVSPTTTITQYDQVNELLNVTHDASTVIGDAVFSIVGGPLPDGFVFDGFSTISGGTRLPPLDGGYGPFRIRLTDGTGESDETGDFRILVEKRTELPHGETVTPTFTVNKSNSLKPFSVLQAPLAQNYLPLSYSIAPTQLPADIEFNTATGELYGKPKVKGEYPGYVITVNETSPDELKAVSDTFAIVVNDPPPIPDQILSRLEGNKDGPAISSQSTGTYLDKLAEFIVGDPHKVEFLRAEPAVAGLSMSDLGQISGTAEATFSGNVTITYWDQGQREGRFILPTEIYPYPAAAAASSSVELPRLLNGSELGLVAEPTNSGFFKGLTWSVDPSGDLLPDGVFINQQSNKLFLSGSTNVSVGTVRHVVFNAKSVANGIDVKVPVKITVAEPLPFKIALADDLKLTWKKNETTGLVTSRDPFNPAVFLSGSYVSPLKYSLVNAPSWLTIDARTGALSGTPPTFGEFEVGLLVSDLENRVAEAAGAITFKIFSTLDGNVSFNPGAQKLVVRSAETFETVGPVVSNVVRPITVTHSAPATVAFDETSMQFKGQVEELSKWALTITDAHNRQSSVAIEVVATDPLGKPAVVQNAVARNFLASDPVNVSFSGSDYVMGTASYMITGDAPGTLYHKSTSKNGLLNYQWFDGDGGMKTITQQSDETIQDVEKRLASDALIFDTEALTLKGVASKKGSFPLSVVAYDDHEKTGYLVNPADLTRQDYNYASREFTLTVEDRKPLIFAAPSVLNEGIQYDPADKIVLKLSEAEDNLGKVEYLFSGLPGQVYYRHINKGLREYSLSQFGTAVIQQFAGETIEETELRLPPDAMIFDVDNLTLEGIANSSGDFEIAVSAVDHPEITGLENNDLNTATETVSIKVKPAASLSVANVLGDNDLATTETLHQYTSSPQMVSVVRNAAYGRAVTWTQVSGTLPNKVRGVGQGDRLAYSGMPDQKGVFNGIAWRAKDVAGRDITTSPIGFTVTDRLPLQLVSNKTDPRMMIVYETNADILVSAVNSAHGEGIEPGDWVISGADRLPPGVDYSIDGTGVRFSGTSDVIGNYSGITLTARDALNMSATIALTFNVVSNPEDIILNVSDIRTKIGFPVAMEPPFASDPLSTDNTYGKLRFYSYQIGDIPQISLNEATGAIGGKFDSASVVKFNLFVTDETERLISKPVTVEVMPNLRLIVPAQVSMTQGEIADQTISTDYVLGDVSYRKGAGSWPEGLSVDPITGSITGDVIAASGTYPGLTIEGTDTFSEFKDVRQSNVFSIVIQPTTASPDIADQVKTILGSKGGEPISWKPVPAAGWASGVVENESRKAWNFSGTEYTASHDLAQYGLMFNKSTGEISGVPTEAFIIRDFVITVKSQQGDADSTLPFWIGVSPEGDIDVVEDQQTEMNVRIGGEFKPVRPQFENVIGNLVYSKVSGIFTFGVDPSNGQLTWDIATSSWGAGAYPVVIQVKDEFGRIANVTQTVNVKAALGVSISERLDLDRSATYSNAFQPTLSNVFGTATYAVTGLPDGLTYDTATGALSGKVSDQYQDSDKFTVTFTVTDSWDGAKQSASTIIGFASARQYWRVLDRVTNPGYYDRNYRAYVTGGVDTMTWYTSDGSTPAKIIGPTIASGWFGLDTVWAISGRATDGLHITRDSVGFWRAYKFATPVVINSVNLKYTNGWTLTTTPFKGAVVQSSADGIAWKDEFSGYTLNGLDYLIKR